MANGIKFEGMERMQRRLNELVEQAPEAAAKGLLKGAHLAMNRSKRIVPVVTGRLRDSGWVASPKVSRDGAFIRLGYAAPYAGYVHEGTRYFEGRKYLSRALEEKADDIVKLVRDAIREEAERGH